MTPDEAKIEAALAALAHPALDPKLAARALAHPDPRVRLAAAAAPALPEDAQVTLMQRGRFAPWDSEADLRAVAARRPLASAKVVSMALDDRDPNVRLAPFSGAPLLPEHYDRVLARAEPAQVMAAARTPGWTAEHTALLAARPDFGSKLLAEKLLDMPLEKAERAGSSPLFLYRGESSPKRNFQDLAGHSDYNRVGSPPMMFFAVDPEDARSYGPYVHKVSVSPYLNVADPKTLVSVARRAGRSWRKGDLYHPLVNRPEVRRQLLEEGYHGVRYPDSHPNFSEGETVGLFRDVASGGGHVHSIERDGRRLFEQTKVAKAEDLEKSEPELAKAERDVSSYFLPDHASVRRAASFFGAEAPDHEAKFRSALWEHDGDAEKAALAAHGAPVTEENLRALRAVRGLSQDERRRVSEEFAKPSPRTEVEAAYPPDREAAEGLRRAFEKGYVEPIDLPGRNSAGSLVARDQDSGRAWILKKVNPRNEACYWQIAERWGVSAWVARVSLVKIAGEERAAVELQPWAWKSLDDLLRADPSGPARLLQPFLAAGVLHRLAALDWVLGNGDRNAGNVLVSPDRQRFRLIDEGNAFDPAFDPPRDRRSYVPAYLRAWSSTPFNSLAPEEKLKALPLLAARQEEDLRAWIEGLDAEGTAADLRRYEIDPGPVMERLARLRAGAGTERADLAINRAWVGA